MLRNCATVWETKSVIQVQRRLRREYGEQVPGMQSIKRWLRQFQETGSVLHQKGGGRPSVHADIVDMVREQCALSRYAGLICSFADGTLSTKRFFRQDGVDRHWGLTVTVSEQKFSKPMTGGSG
jgi:transposase